MEPTWRGTEVRSDGGPRLQLSPEEDKNLGDVQWLAPCLSESLLHPGPFPQFGCVRCTHTSFQ